MANADAFRDCTYYFVLFAQNTKSDWSTCFRRPWFAPPPVRATEFQTPLTVAVNGCNTFIYLCFWFKKKQFTILFFHLWRTRPVNMTQIGDFWPKMRQIPRKVKIAILWRARSLRWDECLWQPAYGFLLLLRVESISFIIFPRADHLLLVFYGHFMRAKRCKIALLWTDRRNI